MATLFYKSRGGCIAIPLRGQDTELLRQHRLQQEAERTLLGIDLKEEDLVFARYDGSPLDPGTVYHTLRDILEQVGIPHIRFHDLRHTHATLLL